MQPDCRRMKKFGLYSCTWNDGCSMHLGPPVIHDFGSTPGSTKELAGCGGIADAAGAAGAGACASRADTLSTASDPSNRPTARAVTTHSLPAAQSTPASACRV